MFDPTQYDHTIEDELHWGGWDAIAIIHSFIFSFFLFHFFFVWQTQGKPQIHPPTKVLFR